MRLHGALHMLLHGASRSRARNRRWPLTVGPALRHSYPVCSIVQTPLLLCTGKPFSVTQTLGPVLAQYIAGRMTPNPDELINLVRSRKEFAHASKRV